MRPRYLIVTDLIRELGGAEKVARLLAVGEGTVRKYVEDPERSGRDMPQEKALTLLRFASQIASNDQAQTLVDEYLEHFVHGSDRKIIRLSALRELEEVLLSLKNGKALYSVIERCPDCKGPLKIVGKDNGFFVYQCDNCHGGKEEAGA